MHPLPAGARAASLLAVLGLAACGSGQVEDGFEGKDLASAWIADRFAAGAVEMQSQIVHSGTGAAKITLHAGDVPEPANPRNQSLPTERDELMEAFLLWSRMDVDYRYRFSLYLPADFPIVPTRLVLAQWKQLCPWGDCEPDNPVVALRYIGGELLVTRQAPTERVVLYSTREEIRGRWQDLRFEMRFSRTQQGRIRAWLNGASIVDYRGPTAYPNAGGYPRWFNRFYFKMGLYRDRMGAPMVVYLDDYQKVRLSAIDLE